MDLLEKSEEVSNYIRECNNIIHIKGHEIAKEYGLTYDQYHILLYLRDKSECPPSIGDLSSKFKRAQNTISEKISRLEEKNLVEKIADESDRRIMRVRILDKGLAIMDKISKERTERISYRTLKKMEEEDVDRLIKDLKFLYDSFKEEI